MARIVKTRNAPSLASMTEFNALKEKVTAVDNWTQGNALTEIQQDTLFASYTAKLEGFDESILGRVVKLEETDNDIKANIVAQTGRINNVKASVDTIALELIDVKADLVETDSNFEKLGMTAVVGN